MKQPLEPEEMKKEKKKVVVVVSHMTTQHFYLWREALGLEVHKLNLFLLLRLFDQSWLDNWVAFALCTHHRGDEP